MQTSVCRSTLAAAAAESSDSLHQHGPLLGPLRWSTLLTLQQGQLCPDHGREVRVRRHRERRARHGCTGSP